ncbi:MAG TPA: NADH-quinone oxidoreductase subunit H [bacterium]|jgi:formate hydrogenlyase subunit 4|nr:NADH-quinone oxidoreductase subunit H [bacterium]MDX9805852.1 NADH-quinone oxidoreductase subunit H [bacterium]HNZ53150.1 NADH-quinone oxidoreductase subunit H [bacterium]HOB71895.1 NADH-quinone oxidoreductase subunit H [bacterium]HOG43492.1 NADH-quinone oxidoreductase subunit H [bacterium]
MELIEIVQGLISFFLILAFSPLFAGIVNKQKALFIGKKGAPVLQPYYELIKLFKKETINAGDSSFISVFSPLINFTSVTVAAAILPIGLWQPLISFEGDIILFAYLLGLARFFQILAAMDIGSSFEGMGASREALFAVFAEPIFFFTVGSIAFISGHTSISGIFHSVSLNNISVIVFVVVCSISSFILAVTECSRMPVDDPNTHLELTMIHEVMILDNSGIDLFFYQISSYIKLFIYSVIITSFFYPFSVENYWLALLVFLVVMFAISSVLALTETVTSRFRMKNIPQYLLFATAIGILNLLIFTFSE